MKTVNGQVCETFQQACHLLGLLEDDAHWQLTVQEAASAHSAQKVRDLFAIIIVTCCPSNPTQLWDNHKESMTENILNDAQAANPQLNLTYTAAMFNLAKICLEGKVMHMVGKTLQQLGINSPIRTDTNPLNREILREQNYNTIDLHGRVSRDYPTLVPDQKVAYDQIKDLVHNNAGGIVFLDAPGGTGKTFLLNLLLDTVRTMNCIAIAVASSGIAATLLHWGRTAHSALKLPLNLATAETAVCSISKGTATAQVLHQFRLIVWDECTLSQKKAMEAADQPLQHLNNALFGGVTVVLAGDFRQTLPVIPKGTPADELNACLKQSPLWSKIKKLTHSTYMRVHKCNDPAAADFARLLMDIGNGRLPLDTNGQVTIPAGCGTIVTTTQELQAKVYPNLAAHFKDYDYFCECAILAPKNDTVNKLNAHILSEFPGTAQSYRSIDKVTEVDHAVQYPVQFLKSLAPSGMPPHNLALTVGAPIILLCNLDALKLCNGTRLCVEQLQSHVIEARIMTGCGKRERVFIPRIPLISSEMSFQFKQIQFHIRVCFAMTINKAQGQTLTFAGMHL